MSIELLNQDGYGLWYSICKVTTLDPDSPGRELQPLLSVQYIYPITSRDVILYTLIGWIDGIPGPAGPLYTYIYYTIIEGGVTPIHSLILYRYMYMDSMVWSIKDRGYILYYIVTICILMYRYGPTGPVLLLYIYIYTVIVLVYTGI